ncbi:cytochrome P450 [Melanomma pulvis-pyrius CBS 109.77]|uniref:Cytochrome P450 n=1 Tax=Melanomma pulvis-pyrius CBS 109.77 TaxID=1314802 RepID=A0A6A6XCB4_9PLEO|nr:cytochrome P450 [Melanomma pulvis-pyrius CBS 109.77]
MAMNYSVIVGAVTAVYVSLRLLLHYTQDRREPHPLDTLIPFVSPVIGISRNKTNYYVMLRDRYNLPIYTLRMPGSRIYVVNSPALISAVQRQYKALAFMPLVAKASVKVSRFSKTASDIINTNTNGEEGDWGYVMTFHDTIQPSLAPGTHLDAMNRVMLGLVAEYLNRLREQLPTTVRLFDWVKHQITLATTSSTYGPSNPYKSPTVEAAFWTFKSGMSDLIMGLNYTHTASEAIRAMDIGATAFENYFSDNHRQGGSALVQARYSHSMDHHIPLNDIARSEFANGVALLSNTVPNTFWMLYHLYSDPEVLAECRKEVSDVMMVINNNEGEPTHTIDMSKVKTSCPVLLSTYKEVLRVYSTAVSARLVMEDHMLDNQYLLKKGSTVVMPTPVQHHNPAIWGPTNATFDHLRFASTEKRPNQAGFRAFGGGTTLCPGRHFATTEILAFTAVMIMQFDIEPKFSRWVQPSRNKVEFWEATPSPDEDFEVEIRSVESEKQARHWAFVLSDSDKPIELSAEDLSL